ncbi:citrate lyase acyl carrier protein [Arsenicicoccus dermatophilus]|uniref:citrate lyase acyl carrier protein n=1 Tax=Arsenicicoccus dermatophilus TaxID=1076331 RepID=UPI001F4C659D|nr:citrate lyase acyl carrier protein [Arsenicicoccus dermatophilus]MCH8612731.1 citrate lyase acyl carrier protein [Arsenicicoccus dermatophilus]
MRIVHEAIAGTLESSDVMVRVAPPPGDDGGLDVVVTSAVMAQFGHQIRAVVDEVLRSMDVTAGEVTVEDKGALDWAIRARLQAALVRGCDADPDWAMLQEAGA